PMEETMKRTRRTLFLLAALAATLCLTRGTPLAAGNGPVTTSLSIPFPSGNVNGKYITFTGSIHMVVHALPQDPSLPQDPTRVFTNLAGVSGVGRTSGIHYQATGAA